MNPEEQAHYKLLLESAVAWFNNNPFKGTPSEDSFRQFCQQYIQSLTAYIQSRQPPAVFH